MDERRFGRRFLVYFSLSRGLHRDHFPQFRGVITNLDELLQEAPPFRRWQAQQVRSGSRLPWFTLAWPSRSLG